MALQLTLAPQPCQIADVRQGDILVEASVSFVPLVTFALRTTSSRAFPAASLRWKASLLAKYVHLKANLWRLGAALFRLASVMMAISWMLARVPCAHLAPIVNATSSRRVAATLHQPQGRPSVLRALLQCLLLMDTQRAF
jgi:hypothetical protein